jgi:hypothetical protein
VGAPLAERVGYIRLPDSRPTPGRRDTLGATPITFGYFLGKGNEKTSVVKRRWENDGEQSITSPKR